MDRYVAGIYYVVGFTMALAPLLFTVAPLVLEKGYEYARERGWVK